MSNIRKFASINLDGIDFIIELSLRDYAHLRWEDRQYVVLEPKEFASEKWFSHFLHDSEFDAKEKLVKDIKRTMLYKVSRENKSFDEMEFFKRVARIRTRYLKK